MKKSKPELRVTVFSDYICPFCYIGDARLARLREEYNLQVNWCFLEIHPETSAEGEPVTSLDYQPETWKRMMNTLQNMANEDGLPLQEHDFTTNSRAASQLAEAAKTVSPEVFYKLHERLFEAFFVEGKNIGDRGLLLTLGMDAGMRSEQVHNAWEDPSVENRIRKNHLAAKDLQVSATPTFFVGETRLDGAVPFEQLLQAARQATA